MLMPLLCLVATAGGFEKNVGQADAEVRYLLRSRDVSVFLTDRETVFHTAVLLRDNYAFVAGAINFTGVSDF